MEPDLACNVGVERRDGEAVDNLAVMVADAADEAERGLPEMQGDMAGLDAAGEGLAKADMSTRARPLPGMGRLAVGVEREGDE